MSNLKGSTKALISRAKFRKAQGASVARRNRMADAIRLGRKEMGAKQHRLKYLRREI